MLKLVKTNVLNLSSSDALEYYLKEKKAISTFTIILNG